MPSEMRHPGPINIERYTDALDRQLSSELSQTRRSALPESFHRFARVLRSVLQPTLQSGAMILTSLAVIVAVGATPGSIRAPAPPHTALAAPSAALVIVSDGMRVRDSLPPGEFLTAAEEITINQEADNLDMAPMAKE